MTSTPIIMNKKKFIYDSSEQITLCKHDIEAGFRNCLTDFYEFSTKKHRPIDPCFFEVYDKYVEGVNND